MWAQSTYLVVWREAPSPYLGVGGGVGQSSYLGVWGVRGVSEGVGDGIIQYIDGYQAFYTISGVVIPQRRVP